MIHEPIQFTALRLLHVLIQAGTITLFAFASIGIPCGIRFFVYRRGQINKPVYDALPTTPYQIALSYFITTVYGVILPASLFIAMRSHWEILIFEFTRAINSNWKIALAAVAMFWLSARLLEGALNSDRPRFTGWIDRMLSGLGVVICLEYHASAFMNHADCSLDPTEWTITLFFPQFCILGTTIVYALALMESSRPARPIHRRRRKLAWVAASLCMAVVLSPFWIYAPRVSHRQAVHSIETHLDLINAAARAAELDPRLVAGAIHVAQTRDRSRLIGELLEKQRLALVNASYEHLNNAMPDSRLGPFPLRISEQSAVLNGIEEANGLEKYGLDVPGAAKFIAFYGGEKGTVWKISGAGIHLPEALVDLIQSSPSMDQFFISLVESYRKQFSDNLRTMREELVMARKIDQFMPMAKYTFGSSPLFEKFLGDSTEFEYMGMEDEDMDTYFDPVPFRVFTTFPDRSCLREAWKFTPQTHYFSITEEQGIVFDTDLTILLGAAMLKLADLRSRVESPDGDRFYEIMRRCPYAHPLDFSNRLKKIMHSPEFDRLFGPTPKMEASK